MSGFTPSLALTALQFGQGIIQKNQAAKAYQGQNAALAAQQQADLAQRQKVQQINTRRRQERLRQILASQRARFGAQGLSSANGSAMAVLKGLSEKFDRDQADEGALEAFQADRINDRYNRQIRKNLLEASSARQRASFGLLRQGLRTLPLLEL